MVASKFIQKVKSARKKGLSICHWKIFVLSGENEVLQRKTRSPYIGEGAFFFFAFSIQILYLMTVRDHIGQNVIKTTD